MNIMHAHEVFGHLGETTLQATFAAKDISLTGQFHCNACCAVKGTRKPTKKLATEVITTPNKMLYVDIAGLYSVMNGGNKY